LDNDELLQEVREMGVEIGSVNDLIKINSEYKDLVPILLRYLQEADDEEDKQFIARCLGVKGFTEASEPLVLEFYKASHDSYKWAIGNTLSIIQDKDMAPVLLRIAREKEHGIARQMIVDGLGIYKKNEDVKNALIELLNDDDVVGHAISAIRKMGDKELVKYVEPFLNHKTTWIRNEAKRTLKRLRKT